MLSDHVHSSTSLTHRYSARDQNALLADFAPESSTSFTVPWSASAWLLEIGDQLSRSLDLGIGVEIDQAFRDLLDVGQEGVKELRKKRQRR